MRKADIRIKGNFGELTNSIYVFYTDFEDLERGDVVLVFTKYGVQLGVFVEYNTSKYEPDNFILGKVTNDLITDKINKQKDLLIKDKIEEMSQFVKKIYAL